MKRKLFVLLGVLLIAGLLYAAEQMAKPMINEGARPSDLITHAITENCAAVYSDIVSAIDTVSAIAWRPIVFEPSWSATTRDTLYKAVFACPVGMTATVRAIGACKHSGREANGDTAIAWLRFYDASTDTLHHIVDIKYDTTTVAHGVGTDELTAITADSTAFLSMSAGDVIWCVTWGDTTSEVQAIVGPLLQLDVDFNE